MGLEHRNAQHATSEAGQIQPRDARLRGMNAMFFLRAVLFTLASLTACVLMPFLLVQYPLVGIVVIAVGVYLFSRSFAQRKKFQ